MQLRPDRMFLDFFKKKIESKKEFQFLLGNTFITEMMGKNIEMGYQ